ncbi:MAG TPA: hypothetical protein VNY83_00200, partial [Solirubrobacterales bacterium]|nr:hypothetical protein [Solirubrobacterales bacterium]
MKSEAPSSRDQSFAAAASSRAHVQTSHAAENFFPIVTHLPQSAPTCSPWQSAPEEQGERRPDVERTPRSFARAARRRSTHFTAAPAT